jgi:hypothetical protein
MKTMSIRDRLNRALNGDPVIKPVYVVYDWFVINRKIDWQSMFDLGLGQVNHASLIEIERPNLKIEETVTDDGKVKRKEIRWITEIGELQELSVDGWVQEHLIKTPNDYKIMQRALEDVRFVPTNKYFDKSELELGDSGVTLGQLGQFNDLGYLRTPFQVIQIDFVGLEQFSMDIIMEIPELMELIEMMNEQMIELFSCLNKSKAKHIKLWENLSIDTMGPDMYRKYLIPLYHRITNILDETGKKLHVHYDGNLQLIADDISKLDIYGLDSLTPPPEGDMSIAEAKKHWPEKFFWMHPSLSWDELSDTEVVDKIVQMVQDAENKFCLQLSEEVPPNWKRTLPLILKTLDRYFQ